MARINNSLFHLYTGNPDNNYFEEISEELCLSTNDKEISPINLEYDSLKHDQKEISENAVIQNVFFASTLGSTSLGQTISQIYSSFTNASIEINYRGGFTYDNKLRGTSYEISSSYRHNDEFNIFGFEYDHIIVGFLKEKFHFIEFYFKNEDSEKIKEKIHELFGVKNDGITYITFEEFDKYFYVCFHSKRLLEECLLSYENEQQMLKGKKNKKKK